MSVAMETTVEKETGWRPIPMPLKILFPVFILWVIGSVMNLPYLYENGLPLFGNFVNGTAAVLIAVILDIIGPMTFLFGLWYRKSWAAKWAFAYIGFFVLNGMVALFTVRDTLGLPQILGPTIVGVVFIAVIFWKRGYFELTRKKLR